MKKYCYHALIIAIISLLFVSLEIKHPYYFLADDNANYFLPNFIHNFRSVFENGEIPFFNFHQYLGVPHLSMGQTAVLNPFVYLSIFSSKIFLGHYFGALDILVLIHLIIGGLGIFTLLKYLNLSVESSFFAGISYPLTSFMIYGGDSWWFIPATAAFFPWMLFLSLKILNKNFNFGNLLIIAIVRSLFFFVGYPQYFAYACIFEFLTFFFLLLIKIKNEEIVKKDLKVIAGYYFLSYGITFILILPLFLSIFHQATISVYRHSSLDWNNYSFGSLDVFLWAQGLFLPFLNDDSASAGAFIYENMPYLSHIGYVALFFIFACFLFFLKRDSSIDKVIARLAYCFVILGVFSFLWSSNATFQFIIYHIPVLNRFRWPFKLNLFTNFYLIAIAAIGAHLFFNKLKNTEIRKFVFFALMCAVILNFFSLYLLFPYRSFFSRNINIQVEEFRESAFRNGRVFSWDNHSESPAKNLSFNNATLFNAFHFSGYLDPMLPLSNFEKMLKPFNYEGIYYGAIEDLSINYFRDWGVKYHIARKDKQNYSDFLKRNEIIPIFAERERVVYYDREAKPLFYREKSQTDKEINYQIKTNTIILSVNSEEGGFIIVNFLYHPFFSASVDGLKTDIIKDSNGRMKIYSPVGNREIVIKYTDRYFTIGLIISFTFCVLIIFFLLLWKILKVSPLLYRLTMKK